MEYNPGQVFSMSVVAGIGVSFGLFIGKTVSRFIKHLADFSAGFVIGLIKGDK